MEGIYFYWIFWFGWVFTTFLLNKTKNRMIVTTCILVLIIFSNKDIVVIGTLLNGSILLFLAIGYFVVSKKKKGSMIYYLSVSLILTISYVSFKLFQLYDPVWVMFHPTLKLSLILVILIIMLVREQALRIGLLFIAVAHGEIVYFLFLSNFIQQVKIGQLESLDILALATFFSYLWFAFEKLVAMLDEYVKQRVMLSTSKR